VVDIVQVLLQQKNYQSARNYWKVLKHRLLQEGSESVTKCNQLKMKASDGKKYLTDVADIETILRIIQAVPSPKAEPLKLWLAKVGKERLQDMADPERSLDRARTYWKQQGRSEKWIRNRMMVQENRNKLTEYWKDHEVKECPEFAFLTNLIHKEWSDVSIKEHKEMKGLKTQNLRDHMSDAELIFTALAELSTQQIAESTNATGLPANAGAGKKGGKIAKHARLELEEKTERKVVTVKNFIQREKEIKGIPK